MVEMEFQERQLRCLRQSAADIAGTEQTLELRLPENMPPIGRVLGAWGQCVVRGKDWRGDHAAVNGGVQVNALYESEDGSGLQCVEGWIPFQLRWELRDSKRDGTLIVSCVLRDVDARQVGAEKLMLRASVSAMAQALETEDYPYWEAEGDTGEIQLLQQERKLCVPAEAGECQIRLEEEVILPPGQMDMDRLLFGQLIPSVREAKILDDKLLFRGTATVHAVYLGQDGMLHAWDGELPVSQFAELQREYSDDAELWVMPAVTDMELTRLEDGRMSLKAGILGQYVVYDHPTISLVTDAYSPGCAVELRRQEVMLPVVQQRRAEQMALAQTFPEDGSQLVVGEYRLSQPRMSRSEATVEGVAQILYYDTESRLRTEQANLSQAVSLPEGNWQGWLSPPTAVQGAAMADGIGLQASAGLQAMDVNEKGISMITGLSVGEQEPREGRPSLILRRAGEMSLWELAKKCGSTVAAIRTANGLEGEPEGEKMLIIPVQ